MNQSQLDPLPTDLPFRIVSKTVGRGAYASLVLPHVSLTITEMFTADLNTASRKQFPWTPQRQFLL